MNISEFSLIASSDPSNGATLKSNDGSEFTLFYDNVINIPGGDHGYNYVDIAVWSSSIWYNFPNIVNGVNSEFRLTINAVDFDVSLPTGLYTLTDLNESLKREIDILGGDSSVFQLSADEPTERVNIFLAGTVADPVQIDFTVPNSIRTILGYNSQLLPLLPTTIDFNQLGDVEAEFNQINSVLLHTDLVDSGVRVGRNFSSVVGQVFLTTQPNFQQITQPTSLQWVPSNSLLGQSRSQARFWITDEKNRPLNTRSENWDINLIIRSHKHTLPLPKILGV